MKTPLRVRRAILRSLGLIAAAALLSQCSPNPYPVSPPTYSSGGTLGAADTGQRKSRTAAASAPRPGLGTGFGKAYQSRLTNADFVRASNTPSAVSTLFYNDQAGAEAMTGNYRFKANKTRRIGDRGLLEWGLKSGGRFLKVYRSGRRLVAVGTPGANYEIWLKNHAKAPIEVVASVDGLDVIDGKAANTRKRGYIVAPGKTMTIKGFRTSYESVARFTFDSVDRSYSQLSSGQTRNVGVVGVALYLPKGQDPWTWMPDEVRRRGTAQAFTQAP